MEKKYEILKDTEKDFFGHNVYRIRALKDFGNVKKGDIGGYVESEYNLSQEGDCWIYNNATACENSIVSGNSEIKDHAIVCVHAEIKDHAVVCGNSVVKDCAVVCGNSIVSGNSVVKEFDKVYGNTVVCGDIKLD